MDRRQMLEKLASHTNKFDFIIIGGGATGIGILLETVTRGYTAILLEASDFTKSTSGKSTKLIHGGVRYLAQGNIGLVREASIERGILRKIAPHIVRDQSFIIPVFNVFDSLLYTIGLKFYDMLAGRFRLGRSVRIGRKNVISSLPNLRKEGLRAGVLYHDGQFDDSRLALACLQTAAGYGGIALNYMPVNGFQKDEKGKLCGVITRDELSGEIHKIGAKTIVNATGVFADQILGMDEPGHIKTIRPSQGIHIVIGKEFLPGKHALMIPKTEDGRVLFAVPWLDRVVVGTTDTPVEDIRLEPVALEEEIDFILRTSAKYLNKAPRREDILSIFAGLRPLADTGNSEKTKEISRSHKISVSDSGLFTIIGGKWTTFRKMAEDLVNRVESFHKLQRTNSLTRKLKLSGYKKDINTDEALYLYGSEAEKIKKIAGEEGNSGMLSEELRISMAQVIYSMRYEMAMRVEDILARRTRALLLDAREAARMARGVAEIMASEGGYGEEWIEKEVVSFLKMSKNYIPK